MPAIKVSEKVFYLLYQECVRGAKERPEVRLCGALERYLEDPHPYDSMEDLRDELKQWHCFYTLAEAEEAFGEDYEYKEILKDSRGGFLARRG